MRGKLSLKLEDLTVDSFHTVVTKKEKGTVFGEQCTCWTYCGQNTCPGCPTCGDTCVGSCYNTCDDYSCAESCGGGCGAYSDMCNSYDPCPSAQYTNCGNVICY
jgi:hypothetical protein